MPDTDLGYIVMNTTRLFGLFCLVLSLMTFVGCESSTKEVDVHSLKILLQDTSILNEKDDDKIISEFETMIEIYANMSISERDDFLRTENGKEFIEVYAETALYLAGKLELAGKTDQIRPLNTDQTTKAHLLLKKYEKNPARYQELDAAGAFEDSTDTDVDIDEY